MGYAWGNKSPAIVGTIRAEVVPMALGDGIAVDANQNGQLPVPVWHAYAAAGTYTVRLTAMDDAGASTTVTVDVKVTGQ